MALLNEMSWLEMGIADWVDRLLDLKIFKKIQKKYAGEMPACNIKNILIIRLWALKIWEHSWELYEIVKFTKITKDSTKLKDNK